MVKGMEYWGNLCISYFFELLVFSNNIYYPPSFKQGLLEQKDYGLFMRYILFLYTFSIKIKLINILIVKNKTQQNKKSISPFSGPDNNMSGLFLY